jgi:signal transduction histidine kinase
MRQRAEVFGGWLVTAGLPGGGFAVRAHLPIGTS